MPDLDRLREQQRNDGPMAELTNEQIEEGLRLCEAATPSPWNQGDTDDHPDGDADLVYGPDGDWICGPLSREEDAAFIADSRQLLPTALRELLAARETIKRMEGLEAKWRRLAGHALNYYRQSAITQAADELRSAVEGR